jgi:hypothetical protein
MSQPPVLTTRFDESTGIFWIVVTGEIDFVEIQALIKKLYGGRQYPVRIWDIREMTNVLTQAEMGDLAAGLKALSAGQPVRSALLTESDTQFGMSRALQPRITDTAIDLQVFKTPEAAEAWLLGE